MGLLALRPGDSLTILLDGFVNRLQDFQFPSFLPFKLRGLDSYPGGTRTHCSCQPSLDAPFLRTYPATGARDADCSSKSGLAQIGAQIAHSASQSFAQQRSQGGSINITYFGCDGFNVEVATVQQGPRAFDAKILKIRKR